MRVDQHSQRARSGGALEVERPDQAVAVAGADRAGERLALLVLGRGDGHDLEAPGRRSDLVARLPSAGVGEAGVERLAAR